MIDFKTDERLSFYQMQENYTKGINRYNTDEEVFVRG